MREAVRRHGGEVWIQVDGGVSAVDDRAVRRGRGRRLRRRVGRLRRRVGRGRHRRPAGARGAARARMSDPASLLDRLADSGGYAVDLTITEGLEPGEVLEGVELEACRFERAVLEGAVLRDCTFTDCVFVGCNLNRVDLSGSRFSDCTFVECTALAVIWTRAGEATLSARPWDLERCRLDLASFQEGAIAGSRLVGCSLREADFGGADAQRVDFGESDLSGAVFVGTDLRGASLVGRRGLRVRPVGEPGARAAGRGDRRRRAARRDGAGRRGLTPRPGVPRCGTGHPEVPGARLRVGVLGAQCDAPTETRSRPCPSASSRGWASPPRPWSSCWPCCSSPRCRGRRSAAGCRSR